MSAYIYQPAARATDYPSAVQALRDAGHRVVDGIIQNTSAERVEEILALAVAEGTPFQSRDIDLARYAEYVERAGYHGPYREYYKGNQPEKTLEHFVGLTLLDVGRNDVFVDLASEHSPVPDIYRKLTGCKSYRQDIMYPPGVAGDRIGGDAAAMPVRDGFFSKATLTCSLEHFEQDADSRLFRELARVLRPGGRVCVAPYYCYVEAAVQTDPVMSVPAHVPFDPGVAVHCAQSWGNRHGRFYSPRSFRERIVDAVAGKLRFEFFHFANAHAVDPTVYLRFAIVATRV